MKKAFKISVLLWLSIGILMSCNKNDDGILDDPIVDTNGGSNDDPSNHTDETVFLACDYFMEDRVLTKIPNAKVDYVIGCMMPVGGKITIEPGVIIEVEKGNTGIQVFNGHGVFSLSAIGTSDKPIIIRGVKKEMGYWKGIYFKATSLDNELRHVFIEDAGNDRYTGTGGAGVEQYEGSTLKMSHTTISNCKNFAMFIRPGNVILNNNIFTKNEAPVEVMPSSIRMLDPNSSYSGNTNDYVFIGTNYGRVDWETIWRKLDVPYKVTNQNGEYKEIEIRNELVTIEPGVEVIMAPNTVLIMRRRGILRMNGTAQDKIIFRGEQDVPGYWHGIQFLKSTGTLNKMSHVEIWNAGEVKNANDPNGALRLSDSYLEMDNVTFTNCLDFAVSSLLYSNGSNTNDFTYSNIFLNNTPRKFGDWNNVEIHL